MFYVFSVLFLATYPSTFYRDIVKAICEMVNLNGYTAMWYIFLGFVNIVLARFVMFKGLKYRHILCYVLLSQSCMYLGAVAEVKLVGLLNQLLNYYDIVYNFPINQYFYYIVQDKLFSILMHIVEVILVWKSYDRYYNSDHSIISDLLSSATRLYRHSLAMVISRKNEA